jgi:hypothetical protein
MVRSNAEHCVSNHEACAVASSFETRCTSSAPQDEEPTPYPALTCSTVGSLWLP